ncbi:muconate cycloisomerase [Candidatus Bathyarchaeota archaeon]|nr:muconate cycloisomerase [Candidatus Bathyarchaeota archaeon]
MSVIKEVEAIPLKIPYVRPFVLSRGLVGKPGVPGDHIYVRIETSDGVVGWGEARPMHTWMYETLETAYTSLKRYIAPAIKGVDVFSLNKILKTLDRVLTPVVSSGQPFIKSAVETALYDIIGKVTGQPLHRLIGGRITDHIELSAMMSGEPEAMAEYAREMASKGYRCFKVKIMGDPEEDARRLKAIGDAVPGADIWADANQAYTSYSVRRLLELIKDIRGIICLEQPVPTWDYEGLRRIVSMSPIPVAVDESVFSHYDLFKLLSMDALDLVVLKLAKSGIVGNLKIAALAEAAGIDLFASGMTESGVGFAASLHLYSTLPIVAPIDINGPQFLEDLLVDGLEFEGAKVKVPDKPGLGVEVKEEKLEEYRVKIEL